MKKIEVNHEGKHYTIEESAEGYLVTFPDGHTSLLETYMDTNQDPAFAFDMKLAESLGHHIRKKLNFE